MNVPAIVADVVRDVRARGDAALVALARKHDKVRLDPRRLRVSKAEIEAAYRHLDPDLRRALESCARRIQDFHHQEKRHLPQSWTYVRDGVRLGQIYGPVGSVGLYVPGGRFAYPSTVLMTAIPARMAGVERIVLVTPPARLGVEILAAARIAGVHEVYRVGGPAAVAALAIGTRSLPKVDLIVGPGNALVTEAKRQLFGEVGIDLLAGPSELVVIADETADPSFVAADLAAQAEHDPDARSILISLSRTLLKNVRKRVPKGLAARCEFVFHSDRRKAAEAANAWAGEHVQIITRRPEEILDHLKNGGTFFINGWSPAVIGDYWAGPSHVLPTGRSARFASGLSVLTFLKRSGLVEVSARAYRRGVASALRVAQAEGLTQHARSLDVRMTNETNQGD